MTANAGGVRIVTGHSSGWCDPDTGVCHLDTDDHASTEDAPQPGTAATEE